MAKKSRLYAIPEALFILSDVLFATKMVSQISKSYIPIEEIKLTPPFACIKQFFYQKHIVFSLLICSIHSPALPVSEMLIHTPQHGTTFPFLHSLGGTLN